VSFAPGIVVGGRYRLVGPLGEGAIGVVWRAESSLFGDVAVKLLRPELARDAEAVERFAAEATAAATIAHPNVVGIYDVGETADAIPFFVMELCEGEALDVTIGARGAVGVEYASELLMQVLSALEAAHSLRIVHRDLKPGNIMVVHPQPDCPVVKVLDFGIACRADSQTSSDEGRVFGTPNYMAPEQIRGASVDERADIYASGAILYELLTGRPPFLGRNAAEVMTHVMLRPPKPLRAYDRALPAAMESLLRLCLSKDPEQRPSSATELKRELSKFLVPAPAQRAPLPPRRERKKSEPLLLVKRSGSEIPVVEAPRNMDVPGASEPPLPLVRPRGDAPVSKRRAVLELVGDVAPADDDPTATKP